MVYLYNKNCMKLKQYLKIEGTILIYDIEVVQNHQITNIAVKLNARI